MLRKRPSQEDRGSIPIVEKLYRSSQPSQATAGGFFEDDDEEQERRERVAEARQKRLDAAASSESPPDDCEKCGRALIESFLWQRFSCAVCDSCRDDQGEHKLIPRTEAKDQFMLKDCDFDLRKPVLRYISKKNPHNPRYGDMKLYLKCQLVERMLEVHGNWEALEEAKAARSANREIRSEKTFEKKVKEMRKQIRGLTGTKIERRRAHEHQFGEESYDAEKDEWSKTCTLCDYTLTFEKM